LTLVDEYPDLVPGDASRRLAEAAQMADAWLADRHAAGELNLNLSPLPESALLHGHCQQKAIVGTDPTRRALEMIPNLKVREVDSGCCGMAGSFGYEHSHYEISMAIGRRVLFPAVAAHADGPLVAPGFSCRHQVRDATGRVPLHPVELLWGQVGGGG
jgi:Fe-S oxidoreductase